MATVRQTSSPPGQAGAGSNLPGRQVPARSHALARKNLHSSTVCALAAAVIVALLAAIDPATPWSSVGLRAAAAFALGAAAGLTLSAASHSLHLIRVRTATRESARSARRDQPDEEA